MRRIVIGAVTAAAVGMPGWVVAAQDDSIGPRSTDAASPVTIVAAASAASEPKGEPGATIRLYRSLGRRQCEAGGETLATSLARLRAAGLEVKSAGCGDTGQAVIAMCGAATTEIVVVDVRREDLARAGALGFRPLRELPEARPIACPPVR